MHTLTWDVPCIVDERSYRTVWYLIYIRNIKIHLHKNIKSIEWVHQKVNCIGIWVLTIRIIFRLFSLDFFSFFSTRNIYYYYTKKSQRKSSKEYLRNIRKKNVNIKYLEMTFTKYINILFEENGYTFIRVKNEIWR